MKSHHLRTLRIIIASLFLVSFILIFVDFNSFIPAGYIHKLLYFQFIPSLVKFLDSPLIVLSSGFVIVLVLTLFSGRTYCSFLCPMGIGQDLFSRIGGKVKKRFRRFGYRKADTYLRYSILVIATIVTVIWGIYVLTLLDPFSIFGRFMAFLGRPAVIAINNLLSDVLSKIGINSLAHVDHRHFALLLYSVPVVFFFVAGIMAFTKGRLYCNSICPVGALLGLISKVSLFRIRFDESACVRCGRCSMRCKSSCIDSVNRKFDVSRCVGCFNCINICQEDAISYGVVKIRESEHKTDESRRRFVVGSAMLILGLPAAVHAESKKTPGKENRTAVRINKKNPVCPPGSISFEHFKTQCTACSLCISACPAGVLQPSLKEYGKTGILLPVMDYNKGYCSYECTLCSEICPTNALTPLKTDIKQITQIGKAKVVVENCLVTGAGSCKICSEGCPAKAIYMIPYRGKLMVPSVNEDICAGCGHCEFSCPASPYKAIYVEGNQIHELMDFKN